MRAGAIRALATAAVALAVLACGPAPSTPRPTTLGQPSGTPASQTPGVPSASPSSAPTPGTDAMVEDASLLGLLPASVDGVAVSVEPQAFAEAAADPDFAANVEAAAFPIAVGATDLASGVIAELRDGIFDDGFFRDWRDTYDEGACAQAGGAAGRAEVQLGGRTVYITSCAEGLKVYHAHLDEAGRDLIVSLFSLGEKRYGEQLMAGLGA